MPGNNSVIFSLDNTVHVDSKSNGCKANTSVRVAVEKTRKVSVWLGEALTKKLIICTSGIFVCYFCYGILQEKITKGTYGEQQEKFQCMLSLVCMQCLVNAICAKFATFFHSNDRDVTPNRLYICCSLSYLGAMLASSHALQHVSFPTQVLGKSVKPIPVMFMGVLLAGKRYSIAKYLCILLIVFGVALFMYKDQYSSHIDDSHPHFGIGEILLLVSLTLDGFTGATQDRMRSNYKTGANNMMLYVNVFSVIVVTFGLIVTDEVFEFVAFVSRHPVIIFSFIIFSLASALGQMFIFITVASFGPLTCSIVTTTRKFFTLLASIIIFQNSISRIQWVATSLVFMGIGLDTIYGRETTKII